jgi:hypothetical protein
VQFDMQVLDYNFYFLGSFVQFERCSGAVSFLYFSVYVRTFVRSFSSNIDMYFKKKQYSGGLNTKHHKMAYARSVSVRRWVAGKIEAGRRQVSRIQDTS